MLKFSTNIGLLFKKIKFKKEWGRKQMKKLLWPTVLMILLLLTSRTSAHQYPAEIPENFKNAPSRIICARETPTAIYENRYFSRFAWTVVISGRNGKDSHISYLRYNYRIPPSVQSFVMTESGWKKAENLTDEDRKYLARSGFYWNPEEDKFLTECILRGQK